MSHKLLSNKNQIIKQIITLIQITKENRLYIYQMVDNIAMTPIHIKDSKNKSFRASHCSGMTAFFNIF